MTRHIMFFFTQKRGIHYFKDTPQIKRMTVMWQYCDEDIMEHIEKHGRYSNSYNDILKKQNIFIMTLEGNTYKDYRQVHLLADPICEHMAENLHPYKPIENLNIERDFPEWLV